MGSTQPRPGNIERPPSAFKIGVMVDPLLQIFGWSKRFTMNENKKEMFGKGRAGGTRVPPALFDGRAGGTRVPPARPEPNANYFKLSDVSCEFVVVFFIFDVFVYNI